MGIECGNGKLVKREALLHGVGGGWGETLSSHPRARRSLAPPRRQRLTSVTNFGLPHRPYINRDILACLLLSLGHEVICRNVRAPDKPMIRPVAVQVRVS